MSALWTAVGGMKHARHLRLTPGLREAHPSPLSASGCPACSQLVAHLVLGRRGL